MKDNLLDLDVAAQGPDPKDMEEKVEKMTATLDALQTQYARLLAEHEAGQSRLKRRITRLEKKVVVPAQEVQEVQEIGVEMGSVATTEEKK
ncbi:unnamed protein product [Coregonus sp. 'balchen']|nr:unnamed protein product [Coregonus sp. 'balchen']